MSKRRVLGLSCFVLAALVCAVATAARPAAVSVVNRTYVGMMISENGAFASAILKFDTTSVTLTVLVEGGGLPEVYKGTFTETAAPRSTRWTATFDGTTATGAAVKNATVAAFEDLDAAGTEEKWYGFYQAQQQ